MAISLVLAVNAVLPQPFVWLIFVLTSLQGALDAMQRPALAAITPRLVERSEIPAAAALNSIRSTFGMIAGPALAGVLIAVFGLPFAYGLDVMTFVVGLACLSIKRVMEGLRYARSRQELIGTYLVDTIAMFFGMPIALFPAIATGFGGAKVLGLLYAAIAFGSFLFSATSGWTSRVHRHGMAVVVAAVLWGLAIIAFGFATNLVVAVALLVLAGAADMMSGLFRQVIWNQTIPDSLRGRLASIEQLSFSGGPLLGNLESGIVASLFSVRVSVVSGGVLCVVGCVIAAAMLPVFRAYDNRVWKANTVNV
jgi:MFS family permease